MLVKVAKGLIFHHTGRRVAESVSTAVTLIEEPAEQEQVNFLSHLPYKRRFGTTFSYIGGMAQDEPNVGL